MTQFALMTVNRTGVLARVTGIVCAMGANLQHVEAHPIPDSELALICLRTSVSADQCDRLARKLQRLVDVINVQTNEDVRELTTFVHAAVSQRYHISS